MKELNLAKEKIVSDKYGKIISWIAVKKSTTEFCISLLGSIHLKCWLWLFKIELLNKVCFIFCFFRIRLFLFSFLLSHIEHEMFESRWCREKTKIKTEKQFFANFLEQQTENKSIQN
jgi:hypothetical protein